MSAPGELEASELPSPSQDCDTELWDVLQAVAMGQMRLLSGAGRLERFLG